MWSTAKGMTRREPMGTTARKRRPRPMREKKKRARPMTAPPPVTPATRTTTPMTTVERLVEQILPPRAPRSRKSVAHPHHRHLRKANPDM